MKANNEIEELQAKFELALKLRDDMREDKDLWKKSYEALEKASSSINQIVEGAKSVRWENEGVRLKDTKEWVNFYLALKNTKEKTSKSALSLAPEAKAWKESAQALATALLNIANRTDFADMTLSEFAKLKKAEEKTRKVLQDFQEKGLL